MEQVLRCPAGAAVGLATAELILAIFLLCWPKGIGKADSPQRA
jgi:hypothetical protein